LGLQERVRDVNVEINLSIRKTLGVCRIHGLAALFLKHFNRMLCKFLLLQLLLQKFFLLLFLSIHFIFLALLGENERLSGFGSHVPTQIQVCILFDIVYRVSFLITAVVGL
jgi:hypothetical protein